MDEFRAATESFRGAMRRAVATIASLDDAAWIAGAGRDRLCDSVEHMAISNGLFRGRIAKIAGDPQRDAPYALLEDGEIAHLFERADEPPGVAEPTGTWTDRAIALDAFKRSGDALAETAAGAQTNMRLRGARHPLFGPMDGVQWMLFAAAHTERHRSDIIGRLAKLNAAST
jgi:hypothetical protein